MEKEKESFLKKIRNKYKFVIFNEQTYEELVHVRLSRLNIIAIISFSAVLFIVLVTFLIAGTGLREYIPGYPSAQQRILMVKNANMVDSLVSEIHKRDLFFQSIKSVIRGEAPKGTEDDGLREEASKAKVAPNLNSTKRDSEFRKEVEAEEKFNLTDSKNKNKDPKIDQLYFFPPMKGVVVNKFDEANNHLGIDIVSKKGEIVSSILDGIVVFTGWTVETGYVMIIQHESNLISVYKHNSRLLKKMGSFVKAGEAIANVGNSGELTSGAHLHFELWYKSAVLNPEEYILFK